MNDRLRIIYLADGSSIHTKRWIGWFGKRHDVALLSIPPINPHDWTDSRVQLLPYLKQGHIHYTATIRHILHLRKLIKIFRPDLIHAHFLNPNAWYAAASGFRPYVTTTWGSDLFQVSKFTSILNRWSVRKAALNTADSQEAVDRLEDMVGVPNRVALIQFGVDTEIFSPGRPHVDLRRRWSIPIEAKVIISPRILRPLYNTLTIAEAFCDEAKRHSNWYLVFLAYVADKDYQQRVVDIIASAGLLDRVRFIPGVSHEEMPDLYRTADVVLSVPSSDTTPVTLLEAMACDVPVIASDLPSIREWITHNRNGQLVPPGDKLALVQALEKTFSLPVNVVSYITTSNRDQILQRASQNVHMKKMEIEYFRILKNTNKRAQLA